jgi:V8-like Glu-specific endopeptidase
MAMTSPADARSFTQELKRAVDAFDHRRTAELCEVLIRRLRSTDDPYPEFSAKRTLATLRRKREFQLMARVADVLIASGRDDKIIYRQYAQALLDQGLTVAGLQVLDAAMAAAGDDPAEQAETQGLVGRAHKDRYVATDAAAVGRRRLHLERAVHAYHDAFVEDPRRLWHGINATALLSRAARDGVELEAFPSPKDAADGLARQILAAVKAMGDQPSVWDRATAMEASVALGRFDDALDWLDFYLADPTSDAFEFGSTLRQLTEVWGLTPDTEPGSTLLPLLQAALVQRDGGEVTVGPADVDDQALQRIDEGTGFEKVFGRERFATVRWFRNGLARCRGIARIEEEDGDGVGTGFLVDGPGLHPDLPPAVLITNAHVVPNGVSPDDAILAFRGLDDSAEQGTRIRRVIWSSPADTLDATIIEPEQLPAGVVPCPLARRMPSLTADPRERVYVIGHPQGRPDVQLSILDNHLLDYDDTKVHYRAPTEPGSSGSPVFDRRWAVIALHHSGAWDMPMLHGSGVYEANEGIRLDQIKAALGREL